jgi:hypothetical protein
MKSYGYILILLILASCYGENEKTSRISYLNTNCISSNAWDDIKEKYSTESMVDSVWLKAVHAFEEKPFPTTVLYFKENPEELIGVEYSSVRYVYNPKIKDQVLDGLSSDLSDKEQKRIRNRVQNILMEYQCEAGKKEALELMKEPIY